jgi:hypothetical protein
MNYMSILFIFVFLDRTTNNFFTRVAIYQILFFKKIMFRDGHFVIARHCLKRHKSLLIALFPTTQSLKF